MPEDRSRATQVPSLPEEYPPILSQRSLRQLGLFFGGAAFFGVASVITRRALVKRYRATLPKFYQQSNQPNEFNGAMDAFDALSVATINVLSLSVMFTGGILWVFNISSLDDMRRKIRRGLGSDGENRDNNANEEMEEWLATVLARKERKEAARKASEENNKGR